MPEFLKEIWASKWVKLLALIIGVLLFLYFVARISSILTALAVAWLLAYICDPLVDRLEARRVPRTVGVVLLTFVILLVLVVAELVLVPTIAGEFKRLGQDMPNYAETLSTVLVPKVESALHIELPKTGDEFLRFLNENQAPLNRLVEKLYAPLTNFIQNSVTSLLSLIIGLLTLIVVPVAWFFLLRDIDKINAKLVDLVPLRWKDGFLDFMKQVDEIISNFLHGQIIVAFILAILYSVGLWLILDIPLGLIIGLFAGFAAIVPYLGVVVGMVPALIMAFLQYQDWQHPLGVIAVFAVAQALEGNLITPKIIGDKLGMHPLTVIFALLIWTELAGLFGLLIAVPVTAVLQVLLLRLVERYRQGRLYLNQE